MKLYTYVAALVAWLLGSMYFSHLFPDLVMSTALIGLLGGAVLGQLLHSEWLDFRDLRKARKRAAEADRQLQQIDRDVAQRRARMGLPKWDTE